VTTPGSLEGVLGGGGYAPPGVYIQEDVSPLVGTVGLPPTLVAVLGPASGYQTYVEQITLATTPTVRLAKKGIDVDSVAITRVDTGATVVSGDYTITPTSSPSASQDYYLDLVRDADAAVPNSTPVFVAYQYTDPDYYSPRRFDDYEDVKDVYGQPLNLVTPTLGATDYVAVLSPLSLAAKIAFENGAGELVLVPTTPPASSATTAGQISTARRAALVAAYAKIATNHDVNVVVPLTDGIITADATGAGGELSTHVDAAAADGYLRFGVLGFDPAVTTAPDVLLSTGGFRSKRVALAYAASGGMSYFNGGSGQTLGLGHQYLAAAYGGRMAALPVQKALTRESLRSFSGVSGTGPSNTQKNAYAAAGVAVTEVDRRRRIVVRHGLTTDTTSLNTREISVVRARDALVTLLQDGVESAGLIGQAITLETPLGIKSVVAGLLEAAKSAGTIVEYTGLQVRQRSTDPSVIEVRFGYSPAYPINYIAINFSVNVQTGETDLTEAAA
jgi:hypothetical protein